MFEEKISFSKIILDHKIPVLAHVVRQRTFSVIPNISCKDGFKVTLAARMLWSTTSLVLEAMTEAWPVLERVGTPRPHRPQYWPGESPLTRLFLTFFSFSPLFFSSPCLLLYFLFPRLLLLNWGEESLRRVTSTCPEEGGGAGQTVKPVLPFLHTRSLSMCFSFFRYMDRNPIANSQWLPNVCQSTCGLCAASCCTSVQFAVAINSNVWSFLCIKGPCSRTRSPGSWSNPI